MGRIRERSLRFRRLGLSGWNLLVASTGELVVRLLSLAYVVALARYLQPARFGTFSTLLAYFAFAVSIGNFGLDRLMLRELSRTDDWRRPFAMLLRLRLTAAVVTGICLVGVGYAMSHPDAPLFPVLALASLPAGIGSAYAAAFQARERFGVPAAANTVSAVGMATFCLAGVVAGAPLGFFIGCLLAAEVVRAGWLVAVGWREGWRGKGTLDPEYVRDALRQAWPYGALAVLGTIYFRIDLIMLDALVGGDAVGHYAGAYRVHEALALFPALVLGVLFPRFARLQRTDAAEARALYLSTSRILIWLGCAIALVAITCATPILSLLYSADYRNAVPSFSWLMIGLIFLFWHAPNVTVLFAGDQLGPIVALSFATAGFNIMANLLLIPRFGAAGAAAATAASELLSLLIFTPIVCRRLALPGIGYLKGLLSPRLDRQEWALLLNTERSYSLTGRDDVG